MSGHKTSSETWPSAARSSVRRHRVHPLTWVAAALLLPLACWDLRQAGHDVQLRRQASAQRLLKHPAVTQRSGEIARLSPVVASRELQRTDAITPEP